MHIPTGLAVKCTEQRTQQQNRTIAMERLTAKLLVVLEEQQAAALADIRGDIVKAQWGQQIRNYVFHPYKMVKDIRTGDQELAGSAFCMNRQLHMCLPRADLQHMASLLPIQSTRHVCLFAALSCGPCVFPAGCETSDITAVMDGSLDDFISHYLRHKSKQLQTERLNAPMV